MADKKLIKALQQVIAEIQELESSKDGVIKKQTKATEELSRLQREFDRASENKEAAHIAHAKGDISQEELDDARRAFDVAADNLSRAKDLLPTFGSLKQNMEYDINKLHLQRADALKAVWWSEFEERRDKILKAAGADIIPAVIALMYADRVRIYNYTDGLAELFGNVHRDTYQPIAVKMIDEWEKIKV